jgi:hypothetical protein
MMVKDSRKLEKAIATASFCVAAALAFTALLLNKNADIESGALFTCAQFLTLTATILGIDYKFRPPKGEIKKLEDEKIKNEQ